jgi:hypothetical protein
VTKLEPLTIYPFGTYCYYSDACQIIAERDAEIEHLKKRLRSLHPCPTCGGSGEDFKHGSAFECGWCNGTGVSGSDEDREEIENGIRASTLRDLVRIINDEVIDLEEEHGRS